MFCLYFLFKSNLFSAQNLFIDLFRKTLESCYHGLLYQNVVLSFQAVKTAGGGGGGGGISLQSEKFSTNLLGK